MQWNQQQDLLETRRRKKEAAQKRQFEKQARSLLNICPGDELAEEEAKKRIARGELRIERPGKKMEEVDLISKSDRLMTPIDQMCSFLSGSREQKSTGMYHFRFCLLYI